MLRQLQQAVIYQPGSQREADQRDRPVPVQAQDELAG